jgi:hypothetical protein
MATLDPRKRWDRPGPRPTSIRTDCQLFCADARNRVLAVFGFARAGLGVPGHARVCPGLPGFARESCFRARKQARKHVRVRKHDFELESMFSSSGACSRMLSISLSSSKLISSSNKSFSPSKTWLSNSKAVRGHCWLARICPGMPSARLCPRIAGYTSLFAGYGRLGVL